MNLAIALTAARHGATIANHVGVIKLYKTAGKLSGARVKVSASRQPSTRRRFSVPENCSMRISLFHNAAREALSQVHPLDLLVITGSQVTRNGRNCRTS